MIASNKRNHNHFNVYLCSMEQENTFSINCNGKLLDLSTPIIMGILNVTPDSFSDGGKYNQKDAALFHTEKMINDGATIIDIGAQSTRPNAAYLSAAEEIERLGNIISTIKKEFPQIFVSLDTFYGEVVKFGFDEGIDIVNDISGGDFDLDLLPTVAEVGLPYILMHSNPDYAAMHDKKEYRDVIFSLNKYFSKKVKQINELGIYDIILDPGFGFGKTIEDQIKMIEESKYFGFGQFPVLIGISRKSFIYKPLGKSPLEIGEETQNLHRKVLENGAKILRVHDVSATKKTISTFLTQ